jgi:ATP-dependent DNA helicase RecG
VIEIEPSAMVHSNRRDEVYLRVGDETRRLSFARRQELTYDKGQSVFDGTILPGASTEVLDWERIRGWAEPLGAGDPQRLMRRRGLIRDDGVTAAAVLLFGKEPQAAFPNAYVRVLKFRATERQTGERQHLIQDQSFEGPIDEILVQSSAAVRDLQPTARRLSASGRFANLPLIPEGAWLESIVNAVIHRSYSLGGDHVRVEVFNDRIEVSSPGRFPGLAEARDPRDGMRFARNPRIARVCTELGWGQELGEGIRRMFEEMALFGLPAPSYQQTAGAVRVVLTATSVDPEVAAQLPDGWHDVVAALRQVGRLRTGEVEELLGVTRPTAIRRLNRMQRLGVVEWIHASDTDPTAYWVLVE